MIIENLTFNPKVINYLCTVCLGDNNGAKIALTIIVASLALLGLANWAWNKHFVNKKEISKRK